MSTWPRGMDPSRCVCFLCGFLCHELERQGLVLLSFTLEALDFEHFAVLSVTSRILFLEKVAGRIMVSFFFFITCMEDGLREQESSRT